MSCRDEFGFIEKIKGLFEGIGESEKFDKSGDRSTNIEGIGDDCAVIPLGGGSSLVVTTDLLTEGVHFLRDAVTPYELGRKSLAVNLSDVAAMGAQPIASLLSIALPAECTGQWADRFMEGYRDLSAEHGVALIGGDTTSSKGGVTINVVAIGRVANTNIKRRGAAKAGDLIFVAGRLGESAAGLVDVLDGRFDTPFARIHHNPTAQIDEGVWLGARSEVHAMIDISDGLASDLQHILTLSGVDAVVDVELIPTDVELRLAVAGGEDYKLLFTASGSASEAAQLQSDFEARFGQPIYIVGEIVERTDSEPRLIWRRNGEPFGTDWHGFTHF